MSFNKPTPQTIFQRLSSRIELDLPKASTWLRKSFEAIVATIVTMATYELYGYLDYISRQILVETAEDEYLERHASGWGIKRKPATASIGTVKLNGTTGITVPAGSILSRADGTTYTTNDDATMTAGTTLVGITATVKEAAGNTPVGSSLNLSSPIAGIQSAAIVQTGGLSNGNDVEDDEALRARVINRRRNPPQGGNDNDYVTWAEEVSGVTRVWVYPRQLGIGTVLVLFVMDDKTDTIIPTADEIAAVQSHIDAPSVKPVTADVTVAAPTAVPVDIEIHLNPNTTAVQAAVTAEVKDFFKREAVPGGTLYLSRLNEAISTAEGEFDHAVIGVPANIVSSFGQMSVVGNITFEGM